MFCPVCGQRIYPRIAPAVIVGVTDGDRIMMTRYAGRAYKGHALIAGFCEIGESVEETVRREVMEEVGLRVKNIRYYRSQPWGFAFNLLMGFYCEVDGDTRVTMDEEELSVAKWVDARDIGQEERNLSLTADMIMHFKECRLEEGKEKSRGMATSRVTVSSSQQGRGRATRGFSSRLPRRRLQIRPRARVIPQRRWGFDAMSARAARIQTAPYSPRAVTKGMSPSRKGQRRFACIQYRIEKSSSCSVIPSPVPDPGTRRCPGPCAGPVPENGSPDSTQTYY